MSRLTRAIDCTGSLLRNRFLYNSLMHARYLIAEQFPRSAVCTAQKVLTMGVPLFGWMAKKLFGTRNERMVKRYL